ncbi:hypothetical protein M9H77_02320 [Catharanthus roseus]|uniref:Uncharacterized protein n=1 Tax=Catharanthus roseus TaxID=4058 RepID=A0ACC0C8G2_CATRO|nr:hypothetical protein M9H77_02320 [Catharanthus roseus]
MVLKAQVSRQRRCVLIHSDFPATPEPFKKEISMGPLIRKTGKYAWPCSNNENDEKETKISENGMKTTKMEPCLTIVFICNLIVTRLDYLQDYLELKKQEQSRATNWGLFGAID